MPIEATGKVHHIGATETRGNFTFRRFVVETGDNPKYPQFVEFQTTRDGIDKLDSIRVGEEVVVTFNLRGREWKSPQGEVKWFNTLDAWKIDRVKGATQGAPPPTHPNAPSQPAIPEDDIPFLSCSMSDDPSPIARILR